MQRFSKNSEVFSRGKIACNFYPPLNGKIFFDIKAVNLKVFVDLFVE